MFNFKKSETLMTHIFTPGGCSSGSLPELHDEPMGQRLHLKTKEHLERQVGAPLGKVRTPNGSCPPRIIVTMEKPSVLGISRHCLVEYMSPRAWRGRNAAISQVLHTFSCWSLPAAVINMNAEKENTQPQPIQGMTHGSVTDKHPSEGMWSQTAVGWLALAFGLFSVGIDLWRHSSSANLE